VKATREFIEGLKKQGYSVKYDVSLKGVSRVKHHADVLAQHPNGKRIIGVETRGKETAAEIIGTFMIALDCKAEAFYIAEKKLDEEARKLAETYKIIVVTETR
jgi:hypothetical protein